VDAAHHRAALLWARATTNVTALANLLRESGILKAMNDRIAGLAAT
jgi:hypothetical protein